MAILKIALVLLRNKIMKHSSKHASTRGFSLIEILVSIVIAGILATLISYSLGFLISSDANARKDQSRRVEISRAMELIANDVRMAQRINRTSASLSSQIAGVAINSSNTANLFNPALNLGTPVLYLEIPLGVCPASGVDVVDRVIYDVRYKSQRDLWLGPQILYRYGRIANEDGSIDPCSLPVNNVVIADSLVSYSPPRCFSPAILSGAISAPQSGFHACVNKDRVIVTFAGALSRGNVYKAQETFASRVSTN
jgi:prepilin-type N-terminal cleavage/methylation domain-containing protein